MDIFEHNYAFYSLLFFSAVISISEASIENSKSHHHHHDSSHENSEDHRVCEKYTEEVCKPVRRSRILGGRISSPREYPHMAMLGYGDKGAPWICAGTLISKTFVLTAAHCVRHPRIIPPKWIRLGELDWSIDTDDAKPVDYEIAEFFSHQDYIWTHNHNDIALLKFHGLSAFTPYTRPICLNVLKNIPNKEFVVVGWGHIQNNGPKSKELRSVELDLQDNAICRSLYSNKFVEEMMICAGYAPGGKDTCQGDSGGPLLIQNEKNKCLTIPIYTQIGIVSFGRDCGVANQSAVYTKISNYIPWIESIVWK